MTIEVVNESGHEADERALAGVARHVLDSLRVDPLAELSVLLVDEPAMTALHVQWMDEPGPTDVMAFPMDDLRPDGGSGGRSDAEHGPGPALLGDVVICPPVAAAQAAGAGHSTADELALLCVHGVLHLLGYDHGEPDEEREMFRLQGELLTAWRAARGDGPPA